MPRNEKNPISFVSRPNRGSRALESQSQLRRKLRIREKTWLVEIFSDPTNTTWNPKQPFINGCFNWMIPNLYIGNGCFTKHPFINGCLGFQALKPIKNKWNKKTQLKYLDVQTRNLIPLFRSWIIDPKKTCHLLPGDPENLLQVVMKWRAQEIFLL